ncbi:MAG: isoleucine--tRNA ligase [Candidatus Uhrbacteria bacterium]|nr:isoleucine--tRNA ligase [Candidatus Uhrbacteria bacterium]
MADQHSPDAAQQEGRSGRPDFPALEQEILSFWDKKEIFKRSIDERPENKPFVFYDGPPFATGLPHYGHLLQSIVKDAIPRYKTMQGFRVDRRWGWDCHGLPIESLIEKEKGLTSKDEVCAFGIQNFSDSCRSSVSRYVNEWGEYIRRLGRWVDMENAYRTMDDSYIESVWWVFAELVKKGLIYKDRRVSLYSPKRATPIANFEVAMDNAYVDHTDPTVTIKFAVKGKANTFFLAWTTTPWTLISNVALAVNPTLVYTTVRIVETGEQLIFAESRINDVLRQYYPLDTSEEDAQPMPFEIVERHRGEDLQGMSYEPLYGFFPVEHGHRVVTADYVSDVDGTGIVHIAPAYGEEDFQVGKKHKLPFIEALDDQGRFLDEVTPWAGMYYADANAPVMEDLESRQVLYRKESITHSVPIDPRSKDLLIYRAQSAWFVDVIKLKTKLLESAKRINWHPDHMKEGRFGKGLETSPDWCISRTRYWGAPLPVWECESCSERKIVSSIKELRESSTPESFPDNLDIHRPGIDNVLFTCPSCGCVMRRIPEVFDCWFESGSMPFASMHYPFENKDWMDSHFPADFIGEAQDQTRGWFRVLHIIATGLTGKPAFKNVIVTGMVLNEAGKKMSKREKNYPDPFEVITSYGADALRMYLLSSPVVSGESLNFSVRDIDEVVRKFLTILWNVSVFYKTYAGEDRIELAKPRSSHVLDRWITARLHALIVEVTQAYERYDLSAAVRPLRTFVDDLSTWWLRRSRDRMRGEDAYERLDALKTLREVMLDLSMLMAPVTPFMAERLYKDLEGMKASVHLEKWPKEDPRIIDERLLEDMAWVRRVVSVGLEQRVAVKMPIRQALAKATIRTADAALVSRLQLKNDLLDLIREELNVEAVAFEVGSEPDIALILDTELTPELKAKGMAREVARHIMATRKASGLQPQDQIKVEMAIQDVDLRAMVSGLAESISPQIKAVSIDIVDAFTDEGESRTIKLDGNEVGLRIAKVE